MNWDDLRYFVALHRMGTLSEAGRALGVNHTTVSRRIQALETALGGVLFDKKIDGWTLTALGKSLVDSADEVGTRVLALQRQARAMDPEEGGVVRVSTSQFLDRTLVLPAAAAMRVALPHITLEIVEAVKVLSLPRQEADIGLRFLRRGLTVGAPSDYISRLGAFGWALYGRRDLVAEHGLDAANLSLENVPVVSYSGDAPHNPGEDFIRSGSTGTPRTVLSISTMYGVAEAVEQGIGVGVIPHRFATPNLVRLSNELLWMDAWLAVHEDMRRNARVRTVCDFLKQWCAANPDRFDEE